MRGPPARAGLLAGETGPADAGRSDEDKEERPGQEVEPAAGLRQGSGWARREVRFQQGLEEVREGVTQIPGKVVPDRGSECKGPEAAACPGHVNSGSRKRPVGQGKPEEERGTERHRGNTAG